MIVPLMVEEGRRLRLPDFIPAQVCPAIRVQDGMGGPQDTLSVYVAVHDRVQPVAQDIELFRRACLGHKVPPGDEERRGGWENGGRGREVNVSAPVEPFDGEIPEVEIGLR